MVQLIRLSNTLTVPRNGLSSAEQELLRKFDEKFAVTGKALGDVQISVKDLLQKPEWLKLVAEAKTLYITLRKTPYSSPAINGAEELAQWFGQWPAFHDAEILGLNLVRNGISTLELLCFEASEDFDSEPPSNSNKKCHVTFHLEDVYDLELANFGQNRIESLIINEFKEAGFSIEIAPWLGLHGKISARQGSVSFKPIQS